VILACLDRFVLGDAEDYPSHLETLVHFFVTARVLREEVLLGVRTDDRLVACALVSDPAGEPSPALADVRAATRDRLGDEARGRYEAFGTATQGFELEEPHLHERRHRGSVGHDGAPAPAAAKVRKRRTESGET
jgi:hypothetical protein